MKLGTFTRPPYQQLNVTVLPAHIFSLKNTTSLEGTLDHIISNGSKPICWLMKGIYSTRAGEQHQLCPSNTLARFSETSATKHHLPLLAISELAINNKLYNLKNLASKAFLT